MKRCALIVIAALLVAALVLPLACATPASSPAPNTKADWPKALRVSTTPAGSGLAVYAIAIAAIIEKYTGVITSPQHCGSGIEAVRLFAKGEVDLTTSGTIDVAGLYRDKGADIVRGFTGAFGAFGHFVVRADSKIRTIADLKGKRCMFQRPGQPVYEDTWAAALKAYNLTKNDVTLMPALGQQEAAQALSEGTADAFFHWTAAPTPAFMELDKSAGVRLLPIDPAKISLIIQEPTMAWWVSRGTVRGGTYAGTPEDTPGLSLVSWLAVNKNLSDDFVYNAAKAVIGHIDELNAAHASFKKWTSKDLIADPAVPYHAGAFKYYKEAGILTPEWEQKYKELLAGQSQKS